MNGSLYQQVYERILGRIRSHEYPVGQRLPVEAALLTEYDVSPITLKRALDLLREEGYIIRRPRLGTFVVSDTPTGSTAAASRPLIGCVVTNFDDTFGTHVIGGLLDAKSSANVILKRSLGDPVVEEDLIRALVDNGVDGIILQPSSSEYVPPAILELVMRRFPVVILDRVFDGVPVSSVCTDNVAAAKAAAEYLISSGHSRLGLVTSTSRVSTGEDRKEGFLHAHAAAHIPHEPQNEFRELESTTPGSHVRAEDDVDKLSHFLTSHPDLTGFVTTEYNIAVMLKAALEQLGRTVPEDASIVCFDQPDTFYGPASFHFTHIDQQQALMGSSAIQMVLEQIATPGSVRKLSLPAELVAGRSTGAFPFERPTSAAVGP